MTRGIRHVALVLMGCFGLLFVQLNRIQVFDAESLRDHPENTRTVQRDFERPRGRIVTADGVVVARTEEAEGSFERLRIYPEGELYAHSAGWFSFNLGADGDPVITEGSHKCYYSGAPLVGAPKVKAKGR